MASFLDPNDPRIQGAGAMTDAGDWFSQQGAPTGGSYTGPDIAGGGWTGGAPTGVFPGVQPGQPGTSGGGGDTSWWNPADPKGSINALFGGQPPSSQTILAHAPQLQAAGIQISPPNAEGVTSKINIPGVGWTRILEGGTAGGQGTGWNYVPQGNTGPGGSIPMSGGGLSPLGALAGGLDPSAAGRLGYSGGLGLEPQPLNLGDPTMEPGYEFGRKEGLRGLESLAAAKGTLLTGGTLKAAERFGNDYATTKYGDAYNRLLGENQISYGRALGENQAAYGRLFGEQQNRAGQLLNLSQLGLGAAGQQANLGAGYAGQAGNLLNSQATNIGNNLTGAGNAASAGTIASGNAWQQGLSGVGQGANNALQMYYLSRLYGGGGAGTIPTPPAGYGVLTLRSAPYAP